MLNTESLTVSEEITIPSFQSKHVGKLLFKQSHLKDDGIHFQFDIFVFCVSLSHFAYFSAFNLVNFHPHLTIITFPTECFSLY